MRLIHNSKDELYFVHDAKQEFWPHRKPNGLWVSVEGDQDWHSFLYQNELDEWIGSFTYDITISPRANILYLPSVATIDEFHNKYSVKGVDPWTKDIIDWRKVAEIYDGIIIAPYQWARRLDNPASEWYYSWDCASGCIWNSRSISDFKLIEGYEKCSQQE